MNPLLKAEVCPEPCRTFYNRAFCKNSWRRKAVNCFYKSSILDARLGSEYACEILGALRCLFQWNFWRFSILLLPERNQFKHFFYKSLEAKKSYKNLICLLILSFSYQLFTSMYIKKFSLADFLWHQTWKIIFLSSAPGHMPEI